MEVLCYSWNITEPYSDLILQWMKGAPSVTFGSTSQITAMDVAGFHLFKHSDPDMLAELIRVLENKNNGDNLRRVAYLAIVRAMRGEAASHAAFVASSYGQLPVENFLDPDIVQAAKERLAKEAGSQSR